jgi:hypothetical protein
MAAGGQGTEGLVGQASVGQDTVSRELVAALQAEIEYLRAEGVRKDQIIVGLVNRVPQLGPSAGASGPSEQDENRRLRSWWARLFGRGSLEAPEFCLAR